MRSPRIKPDKGVKRVLNTVLSFSVMALLSLCIFCAINWFAGNAPPFISEVFAAPLHSAAQWDSQPRHITDNCEPPPNLKPHDGDVVLLPSENTNGLTIKYGGVETAVDITRYDLQKAQVHVLSVGNAVSNVQSFTVKIRMQRLRVKDKKWVTYKTCWFNKPAHLLIDGTYVFYEDVVNWWLTDTRHRFRAVATVTLTTDAGTLLKSGKRAVPSL